MRRASGEGVAGASGRIHVVDTHRTVSEALVDLERVRAELTVTDLSGDEPVVHHLWQEEEEEGERVVVLPRNYRPPWKGKFSPARTLPRAPRSGWGYRSRVSPRSNQEAAIRALLGDEEDKILCLGCGRGKTVIALHAAVTDGRLPVLVVVPTSALEDQWRREIAKHTTVPPWMIGTIRGEALDVRGKPIVVGMLKTVSLRVLPAWVYRHFRLVIFDEGHRMGAPLLGRCAGAFTGERWTLTATPERDDGMDALFRHHLGPVVLRDTEHELTATFFLIRTGIRLNESPFRGSGKKLGRLYNYIARHPERNALILGYIRRAVAAGRVPLVLGERIDQLQFFVRSMGYDRAKRRPVAGLFCGQLVVTDKVRYFDEDSQRWRTRKVHARETPKETEARKRRALRRRVLCATSILGKEGLDKESLDTCIIPIPVGGKGRLDQTIGRVLRSMASNPGKCPVVLAFVDQSVSPQWNGRWGRADDEPGFFAKLAARMTDHARELGYRVVVKEHGHE